MKYRRLKKSETYGFSIIEMLIVVGVFAVLSVIATQIVSVSLRNTSKSERLAEVREDVDFAFNVMERQIRNAQSLDCASSGDTSLAYFDQDGNANTLLCNGGGSGQIELNSSRITGTDTYIDCTATPIFICKPSVGTSPASVVISISASDAMGAGTQGAAITTSTTISLRTY